MPKQSQICAQSIAIILCAVATLAMHGCATTYESDIRYSAPNPVGDEFQSGVDRQPTATTLFAMSRVLVRYNKDNEAEMILRNCLEQHPNFVAAYNELAQLYLRRSKVGDAVRVLHDGLAVAPDNSMLHNNLGMCWFVRGEYGRALDQFTKAVALDPDDARYRANMAASLGMKGRYDESFALYEQIVPRAKAHYNLAVICEAVGDRERAEAEFAAAMELDPTLVRR